MYPDKLCQAIVNGKLRQTEVDEPNRVSTGKMSKGQLSSMAQSLCLEIRRERVGAASGNCSWVVRSDGVNRPIGKWPSDWVDAVHDEDGGEDLLGVRPQTGVHILKEAMYGLVCKNSIWQAWDDVSNAELNPEDVRKASELEMQYFEKLRVYDRVDRSELERMGGKLISARWVDVSKGDSVTIDYRSRMVGRKFNIGRDYAHYAATPPL